MQILHDTQCKALVTFLAGFGKMSLKKSVATGSHSVLCYIMCPRYCLRWCIRQSAAEQRLCLSRVDIPNRYT
eukprot:3399270-Amphidinium_carterae.1